MKFERILFPVDFSERCRGAAHYAVALAAQSNAELTLLHVVETPIARPGELDFGALAFESDIEARSKHCRDMLDSFLGSAADTIDVRRELQHGDPARTIVRYAHDNQADLIMIATHGYGAFRRFILGSVTAKVLHDAECPVWTGVHMEHAPPSDAICCRRVLCAVEASAEAERPVRFAAEFAADYGASLHVIHVVPAAEALPERVMDGEMRMMLTRDARKDLEARLARIAPGAELTIETGDVVKNVSAAASRQKSDLLCIGRSAHSGLAGRLRTHAYALIRESPCPVLSV